MHANPSCKWETLTWALFFSLMQKIKRFQWQKKDREKMWYAFYRWSLKQELRRNWSQIKQHVRDQLHIFIYVLPVAGNTMLGWSLVQSSLQTGLPAGSAMQRNPPSRFAAEGNWPVCVELVSVEDDVDAARLSWQWAGGIELLRCCQRD